MNAAFRASVNLNFHWGNAGYSYAFNGKEKDDEITGNSGDSYDFGARIYDSRLGRWNSIDTRSRKNTGFSTYQYVRNTPICRIDPNGETDYYAADGTWIGTNGASDGTKTVVANATIVKQITKASEKGNDYTTEVPATDVYVLPSDQVLNQSIGVFKNTIANDGKSEYTTILDKNGQVTYEGKGPDYDPSQGNTAHGGSTAQLPAPAADGSDVFIHSHPTKIWRTSDGNVTSFPNTPSQGQHQDVGIFASYDLNIVVGKEGDINDSNMKRYVDGGRQDFRRNVISFFDKGGTMLATFTVSAVQKMVKGREGKIYDKYKEKHDKKATADEQKQK